MNRVPPRLVLALALLAGCVLTQVAVLVGTVGVDITVPPGVAVDPLLRIQLATNVIDLGAVLLVPLAVLVISGGGGALGRPAPRALLGNVLTAAVAVGSTLTFLVVLRLAADLVGDSRFLGRVVPGDLFYDAALVLTATAGTLWAYQEMKHDQVGAGGPDQPPTPDPDPPPTPPGTGFPTGPPTKPPTA